MRVRYHCHFGWPTGYARAAHDYLAALYLYADDIDLKIVPLRGDGQHHEARYQCLFPLSTDEADLPADIAIYHDRPSNLIHMPLVNAKRHIAVTTWETWTCPFNDLARFDAIIVPSEWCRMTIREAAPSRPIIVVPHCIDPNFWQHIPATEQGRPYRFYSIGAWSDRKNPMGIIKAYLHAFTKEDPVQLNIYSRDANLIEAKDLIFNRSMLNERHIPELRIHAEEMHEYALLEAHRSNDCYVHLSRGEGFGLGLFEAGFLGKNIIANARTGETEYQYKLDVMHVPGQLTPAFASSFTMVQGNQARSIMHAPPGTDCKQSWFEPDLNMAARHMCAAAADQMRDTNVKRRQSLAAEYGYEPIAGLFERVLKEILL